MKKYFLLKIILLVALLFFLIIKAVPYFINLYLNANAEKIVSDMITRTNDFGGHEVHFGEIIVNYDYRGTFLQLSDVMINPEENNIGKNQIKFNLTFDQASLTGFSWMEFLFQNAINLDSALIENLTIETVTPPIDSLSLRNDTRTQKKGEDYNQIAVKRIRVNKASFENRDSYSDSTRLSIENLFLTGDGFVLTKDDLVNPDALFKADNVEGHMSQAAIHVNNFRNIIYAKDFSFNTSKENVDIGLVRMENKLDPYEYVNQFAHETDWMELKQGSVRLEGMDFQSYFREGSIRAKKLQVNDMNIEVFRDKRKPDNLKRRPKMVHEILRELPFHLEFREVELNNGYVSYEERPQNEAPRSGEIFFDKINATILGATNIPENLKKNDEMKLTASGRLIGTGLIDLEVTYFLSDTTGKFLMNGSIGSMGLANLNNMIGPATKVTLKEGKLNSLFFNIGANDIEGTGQVIVKYEDLEIEILDGDFGYDQNIFQRIGSFLANKLIIKSQNPDKKGELKKGEVYFLRDQNKFIFNYWWKLVLSGLKSTLTGSTEEELRKKADNS